MKFIPGGATDQGQVREANEDGYFVDRRLQLFAVADGMGGHRAGEVASATALEALRASVASGTAIGDAITSANSAVHDKASDDPELQGMGTTLTAIVPDGNGVLIGHVGDSRAYLLRDGELRQLTTDHSLVEELVREGRLTEEQAAVHPQRSIITRALGVDSNVEVDVYPVTLQAGDRLMLCSDGLTTMLRPDAIAGLLRREPDPTRAANLLVDAANAAGGEDNITTIVIDIEDDGADPFAAAPPRVPIEDATTAEVPTLPPVPFPAESNGQPDVPAAHVTAVIPSPAAAAAAAAAASAPPVAPPPAAPGVPDDASAAKDLAKRDRAERRKERHPARSVGRFARFVVPILLILGLAFAVTAWYARRTYYVTFDKQGTVAVYQGRPGGLLMWDPTLVATTKITHADLPDAINESVESRREFSDKDSALDFVDTVRRRADEFASTTTTTTTTLPNTATTTTVAPGSAPSR